MGRPPGLRPGVTAPSPESPPPIGWAALLALVVVYFATGGIGLTSLLQSATVAPVVPTAGLALAVILLTPRSSRRRVLATLWVADFIVERAFGRDGPVEHIVITSIVIGEAWISALIAEAIGGSHLTRLGRLRDVGALLIGALLGSVCGSVLGAAHQMVISGIGFATAFVQWGVPDLVAYTTITPALLLVWRRLGAGWRPPRLAAVAEATLLQLCMGFGCWYAHVGWIVLRGPQPPLAVVALPLLGWAALRFGGLGTTWATLLMGAVSVVQTLRGQSAFTPLSTDPFVQLIWTQVFVVAVGLSMLALAAALAEREASVAAKADALRDSRRTAAQFQAFFEGTPEMIAVVDRELRLVMCTTAWARYQARLHNGVTTLGEPIFRGGRPTSRGEGHRMEEGWREALAGRRVVFADRIPLADGRVADHEHQFVPLRDSAGEVIGATESVRDVAELRGRQEAEARALRLESIGRLAGGVAHDFNNILTAILGYAALVEGSLPEGDPNRGDIAEITHAGRRAARLTSQLLAYASRQMIEPRVVDLSALLGDLDPMLGRLLGENIQLGWQTAGDLWEVYADPGQIEQVVVNLAVNARDAMPGGGRLTITTANLVVTDDSGRSRDLAPGAYVMIAVSDTGAGIAPEIRDRIFEPFFSTKGEGRGTGLGLATVEGIVRQVGGAVGVDSEVGRGTTFKVFLPRATAASGSAKGASEPVSNLQGTERLLLVEDDAALRALTARILRERGYEVIEAGSCEEALVLANEVLRGVALMVSDVVLPGMNGPALASRLAVRHPDMRVLYLSGYAENALVHHGLAPEGTQLLPKPFTPSALLAKIRSVLAA